MRVLHTIDAEYKNGSIIFLSIKLETMENIKQNKLLNKLKSLIIQFYESEKWDHLEYLPIIFWVLLDVFLVFILFQLVLRNI